MYPRRDSNPNSSPWKGDGLTNSPTGACKLLIINRVEAKGLEPSMKNIPACKAGAVANFATPPLNLCYPIILPRIRFRRKSLRPGILTITIQYRQNLYHQLWHNIPFSVTRRWTVYKILWKSINLIHFISCFNLSLLFRWLNHVHP